MSSLQRVKAAHKHSIRHRNEITNSHICGCFHCLYIFKPTEVDHWIDKNDKDVGQTAMCPKCSIDTVIGDQSGYPVNNDFLSSMKNYWCS
ncbi:cytoplasmic protein [Aliiglaciecola sp. M165]|nr:cytoplasmic protein [Aliiglaciecola sp. M165]